METIKCQLRRPTTATIKARVIAKVMTRIQSLFGETRARLPSVTVTKTRSPARYFWVTSWEG